MMYRRMGPEQLEKVIEEVKAKKALELVEKMEKQMKEMDIVILPNVIFSMGV